MLQYFMNLAQSIREREEGQTLAEYALILVFVAVVAITALTLLGTNVSSLLNTIAGDLVP